MSAADPGRRLCLLRGGGDLATGVAWRLHQSGFPVAVTELPEPLTVRRTVALSSAVADGVVDVEGMVGRRADAITDVESFVAAGEIPILVCPGLPHLGASVVVDARLAKRNIDTTIGDADLVIALGPGFVAGHDCHAVVETMRGPRLGRVIRDGPAAPDTGTPGRIGGRDAERVIRSPVDGAVEWEVGIGDRVDEGELMGRAGGEVLVAPFPGVVRGLIRAGTTVRAGTKIGDVDPRPDVRCDEISDKALAIGGGVLEAVMAWPNRSR